MAQMALAGPVPKPFRQSVRKTVLKHKDIKKLSEFPIRIKNLGLEKVLKRNPYHYMTFLSVWFRITMKVGCPIKPFCKMHKFNLY